MGYITKAVAQIRMNESDNAIPVFDIVFGNCNPNEKNLLVLIKVGDPFLRKVSNTTKSHIVYRLIYGRGIRHGNLVRW